MSDKLEIPARISPDGAVRFGESYATRRAHHMRVEGAVLIAIEERHYGDGRREFVEVGRFKLEPIP